MPWQGDSSVTIDRFDGRAHLDFIADYKPAATPNAADNDEDVVTGLSTKERREVMYERYRILVQNDFLKSKLNNAVRIKVRGIIECEQLTLKQNTCSKLLV